MTQTINNIRIGKADVAPDAAAHQPGVPLGHEPGAFERTPGFRTENGMGKATPARATGINPKKRGPIDPSSPVLTPP